MSYTITFHCDRCDGPTSLKVGSLTPKEAYDANLDPTPAFDVQLPLDWGLIESRNGDGRLHHKHFCARCTADLVAAGWAILVRKGGR